MLWARAWQAGLDLGANNRLEAKGRDDGLFISLFPSLATFVAQSPFVFFFLFPGPQPAACALGGGGSRCIVWVEDGRGNNGKLVLLGTELFRLPRVSSAKIILGAWCAELVRHI